MSNPPAGLLIRELIPADRAALGFAFGRLGKQSRFQRFLGAKKQLSERELDWLTHVDHWHHEALIAFSPLPRAPIGITRYVRGAQFDEAEIAVAVTDAWQRHGVGRALMLALRARAIAAGVRRFTATTLTYNAGALALARELGTVAVGPTRDDCFSLAIDLHTAHVTNNCQR